MDIMKKNPKGGRPPKSASEKLKERLTVKMAAADYYALRGKARAAGLTWAEYARTALKERRPPAPHGRTDDPAAAARRYGQQPQSARPKSQLRRICSGSGGVHSSDRKDRYANRSN